MPRPGRERTGSRANGFLIYLPARAGLRTLIPFRIGMRRGKRGLPSPAAKSTGGGAVESPNSAAAAGGLPEIVFAPARPDVRPGHDADVIFEVRQVSGGGRALPVFTTVERLVAALGHEQPWVALPLRNIQQIMGASSVQSIVLDPGAEPGTWQWQASDIESLQRRPG